MDGSYKVLEHTADVGIEAVGTDFAEALEKASEGLSSIMVNMKEIETFEMKDIFLEADDEELLVVKWLNEILFYFDSESFVCKKVQVKEIKKCDGSYKIQGLFFGKCFDPKEDTMLVHVKAVTYHQLSVIKEKDNVMIKVFFDI
jgi:SHS2 domain-containing protein